MEKFFGFIYISGVGWLLDIASFAGLSQFFDMAPRYANFISSLVGVTYVWIVALNRLFDRSEFRKSIYLPIYWGYQALSILAYSALISVLATSAANHNIEEMCNIPFPIVAKIVITGPNLLTNFIFMSILTKLMKPRGKRKQLL